MPVRGGLPGRHASIVDGRVDSCVLSLRVAANGARGQHNDAGGGTAEPASHYSGKARSCPQGRKGDAIKGSLMEMNRHHPLCLGWIANKVLRVRAIQHWMLLEEARGHSVGYLIRHVIHIIDILISADGSMCLGPLVLEPGELPSLYYACIALPDAADRRRHPRRVTEVPFVVRTHSRRPTRLLKRRECAILDVASGNRN